jgi:hypothetical protein
MALALGTLMGALVLGPDAAVAEELVPLTTVDADGYTLVVTDGSGQVGKETHILVTITAKNGFKINEKYPHKLKLAAPTEGLELPKLILKKKDAKIDGKKKLSFLVPVKATRAGTFTVSGKIKLSVCNDKSCLIDKQKLRAKLIAK